ncbi:hypothetical protein Vadar_008895 [Vaccinium darrowii]|uniref:Uncharacterized protein n=1 Tax=Vaccinium darrowii TaxID=229202 RepID=A0ACB7YUB1_9ERIC|nr:hypothetical protein Vadar_008895 [Vaccinium darrowii]
MLRRTPAGTYVIAKVKKENDEGTYILLNGNGATPSGIIPFLDLFDMRLSWWWWRRQRVVAKVMAGHRERERGAVVVVGG